MIKYTVFFALLAIRLLYQPTHAQNSVAPFASNILHISPAAVNKQPLLINFNGNLTNNRILLQWQVMENDAADQFEIEKSSDGKNFSLAALVFGTDKPETDNYWFYEKARQKKFYYRIKMITKSKKAEYSPVINIHPNN